MPNRSLSKLLSQIVLVGLLALLPATLAQAQTDADIRKLIIRESIASYPGNCPCPFDRARNGSRCGERSAYSRPGGYSPLCYDRDITNEMVFDYRKRHGLD